MKQNLGEIKGLKWCTSIKQELKKIDFTWSDEQQILLLKKWWKILLLTKKDENEREKENS